MSRFGSSIWKWSTLALLAAGAVVATLSLALADGGSDPTYFACVNDGSGILKVVSASTECAHNEYKIEWNQQGPAGPPGVQGAPGEAGQDGANGTSQAFVMHTGFNEFQQISDSTSALMVAGLTDLPAGSYVITAEETTSFPSGGNGGEVTCTLTPGGAHGIEGVVATAVTEQRANVVVNDAVTLGDVGAISFSCSGPAGLASDSAVLTAIRVDTLTVQTPPPPPPPGPGAFDALVDGPYPARAGTCTLTLTGSNLKPGSVILVSVNGGGLKQ